MNIRDLTYLIAVAEEKHFGNAAKRCFVSQPTLSAQLKKLEEELGVQLFERSNRQVLVTPIGEDICRQARDILNDIEQLKRSAKAATDPLSGTLHLGIIPTLAPYLLPLIIAPLKNQLPDLELLLREEQTHVIVNKLSKGELDAIILALPIDDNQFVCEELFDETFFVAMPADHPLNKHKEIKLSQLKNETLLLLEDGHCLRDQALDVCKISDIKEKPGFKATSLETLRHMVSVGIGITLLPELSIRHLDKRQKLMAVKPFTNPEPFRRIALLWRKHSAKNACCQEIAEIIRNHV